MAKDIKEACEGLEQHNFAIKKLGEKFNEIAKERTHFMQA